jgi:hypothetical protein
MKSKETYSPVRPSTSLLAVVVLGGLLGGCATGGPQRGRDQQLIGYRHASDAMRKARFVEAKSLLDEALARIAAITAGDRSAKQARSLFHEESRKNFRGEPHERVMAYYYRGILYWMDGEPDNARACFRSAQIQDADAENKDFKADYALLDYLDGLATSKLADDGSDAFRRSSEVAKIEKPPAYDPNANVLIFVEMGSGPTKYAAGVYNEKLKYHPGQTNNVAAVLRAGPLTLRAPAYDDLTFQATTRGGRVVDHINGNKAIFKDSTDIVGDALLVTGAVAITQRGKNSAIDEAGVWMIGAGLLSKVTSYMTTPAADTRAWDNLPNYLGFGAARLAPGNYSGTVEFINPNGAVTKTRQISFTVAQGRDTVIFASDRE